MDNHPRIRNIAFVVLLLIIWWVPHLFVPSRWMLDGVSIAMLVFALYNLKDYGREAVLSFWEGDRSRSALILYGIVGLLLSAVWGRTYGITHRAAGEPEWVTQTPIFGFSLFLMLVGFVLFTKASKEPRIVPNSTGFPTLIAGIAIGAVLFGTKLLEPFVAVVFKLFGSIVAHF